MSQRSWHPETVSKPNVFHQIPASVAGTFVSVFLVQPLEVIKTRLQAEGAKPLTGQLQKTAYTGNVDVLLKIVRHEGASALWKGLRPTLLMVVPSSAIYISGYEHLKYQLSIRPMSIGSNDLHFLVPMLAGVIARSAVATVTSPLELIRTNLQAQSAALPNGIWAGLVLVCGGSPLRNGRWRRLFTGLWPTLLRDVPFSALYWSSYENIKQATLERMRRSGSTRNHDVLVSLTAGSVSGMFSAAVTTPFDVVKTRMQITMPNPQNVKRTTLGIAREIWRDEGVAGLTRGMSARMLRIAPACGIMIGTYELFKTLPLSIAKPTPSKVS